MKQGIRVSVKRVAVVGAGVSGLAAIKSCLEEGMAVDCFELTDDLGGLWRLNEKDDVTSCMESTVLHTCKEMGAYSDFPPPSEFPVFLNHRYQLQYLRLYAAHFSLLDHILFRHKVLTVMPVHGHEEHGRWAVEVLVMDSGNFSVREYDGVMICTGRNRVPRMPELEGMRRFTGLVMHSNDYKRPDLLKGKTVLVVGLGNSGGDIATELSRHAKQVYVSVRHGSWLMPRIAPGGQPMDITLFRRLVNFLRTFSTFGLTSRATELLVQVRVDHDKTGLRPEHRLFSQLPLINDQLSECLLNGSVRLVGAIRYFIPNGVILESAKLCEVDAVVFATGFDTNLSSIVKDMLPWDMTRNLRAYKRVFPLGRTHPTLALVGMVASIGPLCPSLEMQSRWVAAVWAGKARLPSQGKMTKSVDKYERYLEKHICSGCSYRDQIDWMNYMDQLAGFVDAKPKLIRMLFEDPRLFWECFVGPCLPYSFRLRGPHFWTGAREAILSADRRLHHVCLADATKRPGFIKRTIQSVVTHL